MAVEARSGIWWDQPAAAAQSDAWGGGCCLLRGHWGIGLLDGVDFGVSLVSDNSGVGDGVKGPPSDTDIVVSVAGYVALVICN